MPDSIRVVHLKQFYHCCWQMTGTFDRAVGIPVTRRSSTTAMRRHTAPQSIADEDLLAAYSSSRPSFHFPAASAAAAAAAYNDDECSPDQLLLLNPIQVRLILSVTTFTNRCKKNGVTKNRTAHTARTVRTASRNNYRTAWRNTAPRAISWGGVSAYQGAHFTACCVAHMSLCLSVCLSGKCIVVKRLNVSRCRFGW